MLRNVDFGFDERLIDDDPRRDISELGVTPMADLLRHRLEIPLHVGDPNLKRMDEIEVLRMLGEHRREVTGERHVVANEHAVSEGHGEPHRLVMRVADANSKSATLERRFEFHDAEHLHAVLRDGVLFAHRCNVPKAERVNKSTDYFAVRNRAVSCGSRWRWHEGQLLPSELACLRQKYCL